MTTVLRFIVLVSIALLLPACGGGGGGGTTAESAYGVTYDGNGNTGGVVPVDATRYEEAEQVTVLDNTGGLVRAGYAFGGWNTQADGGGTNYGQDDTFHMGGADVTLYARWLPTYSVTYDGNNATGGSVPTDANLYVQGATVTVLGNPNNLLRTGYSFAGWSTQADGGALYAQDATFTMGSGNVTLYAKWGDPGEPKLFGLTPASTSVAVGGTVTFTVTLDAPATSGGIVITLAADAGTTPASVTIPDGQTAANFDYTAGPSAGDATVTATLNTDALPSTVHVVLPLVINEIDYDQPGIDSGEFVEIYNPSSSAVDLSAYTLAFYNGALWNNNYLSVPLSGVLAAGQYLVVAAPGVTVAAGAVVIRFANASDNIQNGAPDAVGLFGPGGLVDALSYEGAVTQSSYNFVEGSPAAVEDSNSLAGSLGRSPNGTDTNNASADWAFFPTPTPGAAN